MTTFHRIKDPACLRKFSFQQLCAIERSVFKMYQDAEWRLSHYRSRAIAHDLEVTHEFLITMETNQDIWSKVRQELFRRLDDLVTIDDILNIPASADYIQQGRG